MIFLKLGGSLITDKDKPATARLAVIRRLAGEIEAFIQVQPETALLLGHGSGSFGHITAAQFHTESGAATPAEWIGFAKVWAVANRLNRIVVDAFLDRQMPIISLPPSASALCAGGTLQNLHTAPIEWALKKHLIPLVQGDVAFDVNQGSTILSTERVFAYLAHALQPTTILLAGREPGVFRDYPSRQELVELITEENIEQIGLSTAEATDVTGGMADKVSSALKLCQQIPGLRVRIFAAEKPQALQEALLGKPLGTLIRSISE